MLGGVWAQESCAFVLLLFPMFYLDSSAKLAATDLKGKLPVVKGINVSHKNLLESRAREGLAR